MKYIIKCSGKGIMHKGHIVGYIEADSAEEAENNLIASGQIPEKERGAFDFISETSEGES